MKDLEPVNVLFVWGESQPSKQKAPTLQSNTGGEQSLVHARFVSLVHAGFLSLVHSRSLYA